MKDASISLQLQKFLFLYCLYRTLKVHLQYYHKGSLNRKKEEIFFSSACDSTELNFFRHRQTKPRNHFNNIQNHYSIQQQQQQQKPTGSKWHQTRYTHARTSQNAITAQLDTHGQGCFVIKFLLFFSSCLIKTPLSALCLCWDFWQINIFPLLQCWGTPHSAPTKKLWRI